MPSSFPRYPFSLSLLYPFPTLSLLVLSIPPSSSFFFPSHRVALPPFRLILPLLSYPFHIPFPFPLPFSSLRLPPPYPLPSLPGYVSRSTFPHRRHCRCPFLVLIFILLLFLFSTLSFIFTVDFLFTYRLSSFKSCWNVSSGHPEEEVQMPGVYDDWSSMGEPRPFHRKISVHWRICEVVWKNAVEDGWISCWPYSI